VGRRIGRGPRRFTDTTQDSGKAVRSPDYRARRPYTIRTTLAPAGWWFELLLVAAFAGLTAALVWWGPILHLDLWVRDFCDAHRPPPLAVIALCLDYLGQGGPVMTLALLLAFWLAWRHRTARPIMLIGLASIMNSVSIVALKRWTSRGAPHYGSIELFSGSAPVEYPSGHVVNGLVYYFVLSVLLAPYLPVLARRLLRWLPGVLVFIGTTYLAYHWLTDSIGGYLLGLFIIRLLERIPWAAVPLPRWLERPRR
jgi:membrane-associated phospholipid phosphatase